MDNNFNYHDNDKCGYHNCPYCIPKEYYIYYEDGSYEYILDCNCGVCIDCSNKKFEEFLLQEMEIYNKNKTENLYENINDN